MWLYGKGENKEIKMKHQKKLSGRERRERERREREREREREKERVENFEEHPKIDL